MRAYAGTSEVTTAPAPMNAYSPSVTPHTIVALAPMDEPRFTRVGRYSCLPGTSLRGFTTFVNTQDRPQNTPSSSVTPAWIDTLSSISTLSPMRLPALTTAYRPTQQR